MDKDTRDLYDSYEKSGKLMIKSYSDLLNHAIQYNNEFIDRYQAIESCKKAGRKTT